MMLLLNETHRGWRANLNHLMVLVFIFELVTLRIERWKNRASS